MNLPLDYTALTYWHCTRATPGHEDKWEAPYSDFERRQVVCRFSTEEIRGWGAPPRYETTVRVADEDVAKANRSDIKIAIRDALQLAAYILQKRSFDAAIAAATPTQP